MGMLLLSIYDYHFFCESACLLALKKLSSGQDYENEQVRTLSLVVKYLINVLSQGVANTRLTRKKVFEVRARIVSHLSRTMLHSIEHP